MKIITHIKDIQVDGKKGKLLVVVFWFATPTVFSNGTLLELDPVRIDAVGIDGAIQELLPAKVKEQFSQDVTEIADASSAKSDKIEITPKADDVITP